MEGSFSHEPRIPPPNVPRRGQFAPPPKNGVDFHDPGARRRYVEQQEAANVSLSEQLQAMRYSERGLRRRKEEAEEEVLEAAEIAERYEYSLDWMHPDIGERDSSATLSDQELDELVLRLRDQRRKRSSGEFEACAPDPGLTHGDVTHNQARHHLGPHRELREVQDRLDRVREESLKLDKALDGEGVQLSRRATREWHTMKTELDELEQSLLVLKERLDARQNQHWESIDRAAQRLSSDRPRSHSEKPEKPRGDGRTIRRWNEA